MSLVLLHISDIHIRAASDLILTKAELLAKTTYSDLFDAEAVAIVVTGDIAFSGKNSEYEQAKIFFKKIKESIQTQTKSPIYFVICPGNHDCDFDKNNSIRKLILENIERDPSTKIDDEIISACTGVQTEFFNFIEELNPKTEKHDRLWQSIVIEIGEKRICFEVLNIAWASKLREEPGKLYFPIDRYISDKSNIDTDLRLVVMHHPMNWFSQSIYRKFRMEVRRLADVIITGHEHDGNVGVISEAESDDSAFIEGCVLQEKSNTAEGSSYNVIKIDLEKNQFMVKRFNWDENRYSAEEYGDWSSYRYLPTKTKSSFKIAEEFQQLLDDPGAFLRHSSGTEIKLSDVFVYPDLRKASQGTGGARREYFSSAKLRGIADSESGVIIQGDEKSGRSSLIYQLYSDYYARGVIPVLIKGRDIGINPNIDNIIKGAIRTQYGANSYQEFGHLERNKKILFIDNFDESKIKSNNHRSEILKQFKDRFSTIVVTVGGLFDLKELIQGDSAKFLARFEHYNLQQFGYVLRSKLIKKWFSLGADGTMNQSDFLGRVDQAERMLNTVMEKLVIPSQPLYLLTLLQSIDAGRGSTLKESALGHYYHYLLTEAFTASGTPPDKLTENFQYSSHLAWEFYLLGKKLLNEYELREFNERFSERWHPTDFSNKLSMLLNSKVLSKTGDEYSFRYQYIYFYLKGLYLSENLSNLDIRRKIEHWCKHLYVRDYANTILFLAHHTNDEFLLNSISKSLNNLFSDRKPITFEGDTSGIKSLIEGAHELQYIGGQPEDHRNRNNEIQDRDREDNDGLMHEEEVAVSLSLVAKMTMLFKTIEILGQILKDQYAKIERPIKKDLIHELFSGPLRAITDFYDYVGKNPDALITEIEESIKKKNIGHDETQRRLSAQKVAAHIMQLITCGFLMRAANSASSENLTQDVYAVVCKKEISFRLIELAILLDSPKAIPRQKLEDLYMDQKKDLIVGQVINMMVLRRLYMFHTTESDMQWLHSKLELDINKQHSINYNEKGRKLLN